MRIAISLLGIFISVGLNAQTWSTMFGGAWGTVVTLFPKGDTVFSHGSFCDSSGSQIESSVFIFWDGNHWINPGYYDFNFSDVTFLGQPVMALRNDTLYVGNHFGQLDTIENTSRIAGWYKDHFFSLSGQAFQNPYMVYGILSLHNFQNRIYLDGHHYCYPLDLITGLVYHDGIQWHNTDTNPMLGSGFTSHFFNFNDSLFIIGRLSLKRDGVWDQYYGLIVSDGYSFWVPPGTESFYQANAACVDTARNYLYVAHWPYISRYDGHSWDNAIGGNRFDGVSKMWMYRGDVFAFDSYATMPTLAEDFPPGIVRWNGHCWRKFGNFRGPYTTLVYHDTLVIGGEFFPWPNPDLPNRYCVGYYEPPGLDTTCYWMNVKMKAYPDTVLVGDTSEIFSNMYDVDYYNWEFGDSTNDTSQFPKHVFTQPGTYTVSCAIGIGNCIDTGYTTILVLDTTNGIGYNQKQIRNLNIFLGQNQPNPHNGTTVIPYKVPQGSKAFLQINTIGGELADEYALNAEQTQITIYTRGFKAGIYFYCLVVDGKKVETKKMVVE